MAQTRHLRGHWAVRPGDTPRRCPRSRTAEGGQDGSSGVSRGGGGRWYRHPVRAERRARAGDAVAPDHGLPAGPALLLDGSRLAHRLRRPGARDVGRPARHHSLPRGGAGPGLRGLRRRAAGHRRDERLGELLRRRQGARGAVLRRGALRHVHSRTERLVLLGRRDRAVERGLRAAGLRRHAGGHHGRADDGLVQQGDQHAQGHGGASDADPGPRWAGLLAHRGRGEAPAGGARSSPRWSAA